MVKNIHAMKAMKATTKPMKAMKAMKAMKDMEDPGHGKTDVQGLIAKWRSGKAIEDAKKQKAKKAKRARMATIAMSLTMVAGIDRKHESTGS